MAPVTAPAGAVEERCRCGNLVAKVTPDGIEIRCRRCKRTHRVRWSAPPRGAPRNEQKRR